jgi:hypothetical protein
MRFGIAADDLDGVLMGAPEEMGGIGAPGARRLVIEIADQLSRSDTWFNHVLALRKYS